VTPEKILLFEKASNYMRVLFSILLSIHVITRSRATAAETSQAANYIEYPSRPVCRLDVSGLMLHPLALAQRYQFAIERSAKVASFASILD